MYVSNRLVSGEVNLSVLDGEEAIINRFVTATDININLWSSLNGYICSRKKETL